MEPLLQALTRPEAYPHEVDGVRLVQTHISAVFLAGPYAYKVKKPVRFGFVDFGTLERRRRFCHEEVRLNRRLAPSVYHGVAPIVEGSDGPRVLDVVPEDPSEASPLDGEGPVVEWAVRMTRLPDRRTLKGLLRRGELAGGDAEAFLRRLARLLAAFHRTAERSEEISRAGNYESVARNARENFEELEDAVGRTLHPDVLRGLRAGTDRLLSRLRPLMERRARAGVPCDGHGDLRLGHVYLLEDGPEEGRVVIVDCIEFDDRFRWADPVADVAFLAMELEFEDREELAALFTAEYLEASEDPEGAELLPYYIAYRDVVRGKVRTLMADEASIPESEREQAAARARRHFLRAFGRLAPPDRRPVLVLLAGLPGVGKSVLARALAREAGFVWMDTDQVRKRITSGRVGKEDGAFEAGAYAPEWTERTYDACLQRARSLLLRGRRVVVEASFRAERHREAFLECARALGVPALLLVCEADRDVVGERLVARVDSGEGASEADLGVYEEMERRWEPLGAATAAAARRVDAGGPPEVTVASVTTILREAGVRA